ncbi:MAG: beta-ketoacyl-[acyl-carrier-protein] synthase family protein [candidate division NC10 bacterium]|nr:beta-ketoacyl-[acyl-carrier-protein] synthase family protein [candidate division NC10 bacterium]
MTPGGNARRVVITGLGVISSLGLGKEAFWESLRGGISGIQEITHFDPRPTGSRLGGEVRGFDPKAFMAASKVRRLDRVSQMAVAAARLALEDARLPDSAEQRQKVGVILGSGLSGLVSTEAFFRSLLDLGPSGANPMFFPNTVPNAPASQVAIEMGLKGPNVTLSHKEVSGENAIAYAAHLIRHGKADVLLAGAVDELSRLLHFSYWRLGALSPNRSGREEACCPFDLRRNGIVLGEGSGMVVLEELSSALSRGAPIYQEVAGWAMSGSPCRVSEYEEGGEGLSRSMSMALQMGKVGPQEPLVISACANSSPQLDLMEARAIRRVWGDQALRIPVSALKSMLGEFHSCGGLRVVASALSLQHQWIPPTINYRMPDPACALDFVPNVGRPADFRHILINGSSNGGSHICLLLRKWVEGDLLERSE